MEFLVDLPLIGWIAILIFSLLCFSLLAGTVFALFSLLFKKNFKTKFFEVCGDVKPEIKERYVAEGKDLVDNQSQVAKLMLKTIRIQLYETGIKRFEINDEKDKNILELITYRITDRLNYELKNDFTRNHITKKPDLQLSLYSKAKAKGYYKLIQEKLYLFNQKLPHFNLPEIMNDISLQEVIALFDDIYTSARGIAGEGGK